ncbi:MAG: tetratricopeptide repeat protein [Myxococcota bacterium]
MPQRVGEAAPLSSIEDIVSLERPPRSKDDPSIDDDEDDDDLSHGDIVGRYSVLSLIGRGGIGVVYKAYDPQLDRSVALKLLRRGRRSVQADLRLLREAQTLAKLKHPNVVAVHDAGLTNHGVFIAMELLEGQTLNLWIDEQTRSVSEVLEVFRAAGRGLSAAHRAGFVHRDFKPSNVVVDDDGRVRVLDFGLAHLVDQPVREPVIDGESTGREDGSRWESWSTELGTVMGTPAFMAPEQFRGGRSDHRSEQFAFAMSLYVALYDRTPLGGRTYEERYQSIESGLNIDERELEVSASGQRVPFRIRKAIVRGLAADPADRFESMEQMLEQLEPPRRPWRGVATTFTLLFGFGVGAVVFDNRAETPCEDPLAALEGTWGPEDRRAVEERFADRTGPDAKASLRRLRDALDGYAEAWVQMYTESCQATFVEHLQSERLFDQRMRCLVRRRNRLRSAIDAIVEAEGASELVNRTILAYKLPALEPCADLEQVASEQPLPEDEAVQEQIAALRREIDEIDTQFEAGDYQGTIERAEQVVAAARGIDYPPLLVEALGALGRAQIAGGVAAEAEQTLTQTIRLGARVGEEWAVTKAWTFLIFALTRQRRTDDALVLRLPAWASVERVGDPMLRSWLLNNLGVLHAERAEDEVAHQYLRQAIDAKRSAYGEEHVDVGISWFNLGNTLVNDGEIEEAAEAFERSLAIFEATVGKDHPHTHFVWSGLCRVERARGQAEQAVSLCTEVLERFEVMPPSPMWLGRVNWTLAEAQRDLGLLHEARRSAERARSYLVGEDPLMVRRIDRWMMTMDVPESETGAKTGAEASGRVR